MWGFLSGKLIGIGIAVAFLFSSFAYVNHKIEKLKEAEIRIDELLAENEKILNDKQNEINIRDFTIKKMEDDFIEYIYQETIASNNEKNITNEIKDVKYNYKSTFDKIRKMEGKIK